MRRSHILLLAMLSVFVLFLDCKGGEGSTQVFGIIKDGNNKPIVNHPVSLVSRERRFNLYSQYDIDTTLYTDEAGEFYFSFIANKNCYYKMESFDSDCYFEHDVLLGGGESNEINFEIINKGILKISYHENLIGDSIIFELTNEKGVLIYDQYKKITTYDIESYPITLPINTKHQVILEWVLHSNGTKISNMVNLQVIQCDTLDYEITK